MNTSARRRRLLLAAGVVLFVCLGQADAQVWGEIELPGGVTAARTALGLGTEARTASAFLVDFIRTFHQFGDADSAAWDRFARYLRFVQELRTSLAGWPDGLHLGTERLARPARDRWRTLAPHLGLRLREVKNRPLVEVDADEQAAERAVWLSALGVDVPRLVQQLNQGDRVRVAVASDVLPLPLPDVWPVLLEQKGRPDVVRLGTTHRPALFYAALMALDRETLGFLQAHPKALDLDTVEAGVLAAFGRSLRIRGGSIAPAGGAAYAPVWVRLVDRRLDDPVEFIRRLVSKDDGRLAFLYDTVAHLDAARQAALFDGAATTEARIDAIERQYRWFRQVEPAWKVGVRPFFRPPFDPSLALALLDVASDGTVGPAWWPHLLEEVAGNDGWPDRRLRDLETRRAGLTWSLAWIFESPSPAARFRLLRYAQRRFANVPRTAASHVEVALRGMTRMPALLLVLERIGVDDPAVLAEAANAAMRLTRAGDVERVGPLLRQWQAGLALLEQVARRRTVPAATANALVQSLARTVPADDWPRPVAVAEWVVDQLGPAMGLTAVGSRDYEAVALETWLAPDAQPTQTLSWEGLEYRIDRVGPVIRDAAAVREAVKGPTLTHLELLVRTRREMSADTRTLTQAKDIAGRLMVVQKALLALRDDKGKPLVETDDLEDAARTIDRIRRDRDLTRVPRQVSKLDYTFDVLSAHVLPALAYALAVSPTPQPGIYADIARRHLVTAYPDMAPAQWQESAWRLPTAGPLPGGGTGTLGALLALDTTVSDGQLRRLAAVDAGMPAVEGNLNPIDRDALTMRLLYLSPPADVASGGAVAVKAMADGRARWRASADAAGPDADTDAALARVLGPIRANLVRWLRDRTQRDAADEMLLPSELARMGMAADATLPPPFGVSSHAFDGCLCVRPPLTLWPVPDWAGRGDSGHLSVLGTEVALRLAEALAELHLPLSLVELVLPMALQDTIDRVGQFSAADWEALAVARFIPAKRVEDYLLALVAEGVLAPPSTPPPGRRH